MNSITFALFLFTGLQGCALTAESDGFLNNGPDALMTAGSPCEDCTKIINLFVDLLSNADLQKKITLGINQLCDHLPGKAGVAELCKEEVDKILPVAISLITVIASPRDICKITGLCGSDDQQKTLGSLLNEALQLAPLQANGKPTSPCSFCIFFIKTLDDLLPKERTEAVVELMEDVCHIMPISYRNQCQFVIGTFSKTLLDALLSFATPKAICTLIRLCKSQEGPPVDPCTLATYRCRDLPTSLKCGTLFYCQRFAWKPLSYNTL
ncbi:surfactant protein Ba isoform X2 [Hippocampus comes]|uniref:surfactant protein Ba isoform X2 n=1 Tax=Hippocampus comes TaxID=109280 RepID=UPI00094E9C2A|nr:PREDICTED: prosaposin-like isoform X2 [Hippocampus comes]